MANESKKDFNAMLKDSKDMPKYVKITDEPSIKNMVGIICILHHQWLMMKL